MRAVAQAHLRTGAPITVHTDAVARTGLVAQEVLRSEGVDPGAVVIGHSGDTTDLDWSSQALTEQMGSVRFRRYKPHGIRPTCDRSDHRCPSGAVSRRNYRARRACSTTSVSAGWMYRTSRPIRSTVRPSVMAWSNGWMSVAA